MGNPDYSAQLHILQWNCNSIKQKMNELPKLFNNFDIILLSETWLFEHDPLYVRGFNSIRNDRNDNLRKGGGVAILINNTFNFILRELKYNCINKMEVLSIFSLIEAPLH